MITIETIDGKEVKINWIIGPEVDNAGDGHVLTRLAEGRDADGAEYVAGAVYCDEEFQHMHDPELTEPSPFKRTAGEVINIVQFNEVVTIKDKATSIVLSFFDLFSHGDDGNSYETAKFQAKRAARICVSEIIRIQNYYDERGEEMRFWNGVKETIENL
jgi:hypothetical protein